MYMVSSIFRPSGSPRVVVRSHRGSAGGSTAVTKGRFQMGQVRMFADTKDCFPLGPSPADIWIIRVD
jgi:hypothetical protein